jgi:hypothetical protein
MLRLSCGESETKKLAGLTPWFSQELPDISQQALLLPVPPRPAHHSAKWLRKARED